MADSTRIQGLRSRILTPETLATGRGANPAPAPQKNCASAPNSFADLLRARQGTAPDGTSASDSVRFSAHAQTRIQSRQIALDASHLDRLQGAVQRAASKGSRDALVLMDDMAMVVSIANRTVVTVVDRENLKQNVFTNIDSAVIA